MQRNPELGPIHAPILAGVERLWANRYLTIGGKPPRPPDLWLDGTGLNPRAKTTTCRQTGTVLSLAGSGAEPDFAAHGPYLGERAVDGAAGKVLQAPNNELGDVDVDDMLMLCAFRASGQDPGGLVAKCPATFNGWLLQVATGASFSRFWSYFADAALNVSYAYSDALAEGRIYLALAAVNRSETAANGHNIWLNGVAATAARSGDPSSVGSLTVAQPLTLLARESTPAAPYSDLLILAALWKADNWFAAGAGGVAEIGAVAKDLASLWLGHTLLHNHGPLTPSTL